MTRLPPPEFADTTPSEETQAAKGLRDDIRQAVDVIRTYVFTPSTQEAAAIDALLVRLLTRVGVSK